MSVKGQEFCGKAMLAPASGRWQRPVPGFSLQRDLRVLEYSLLQPCNLSLPRQPLGLAHWLAAWPQDKPCDLSQIVGQEPDFRFPVAHQGEAKPFAVADARVHTSSQLT